MISVVNIDYCVYHVVQRNERTEFSSSSIVRFNTKVDRCQRRENAEEQRLGRFRQRVAGLHLCR